MGRFKYLTEGKEKTFKIGDVDYKVGPLKGKYLGLFMGQADKDDTNKNIMLLLLATLQETEPALTVADIEELPIEITSKLLEMVYDVNGFTSKQ
jgi:hypothetical protein